MSKIVDNLYLIAAVDENWAIGYEGRLLFRIPEDLRFNFRARTVGQIVIMGRTTYESLPGKKPLPDRLNIVISRALAAADYENVLFCNSLAEVLEIIEGFKERKIFVAGGASVYRLMLPYCSLAFITKVKAVKRADRYMVNLDKDPDWDLIEESLPRTHGDNLRFSYATYRRRVD